MGDGGAHREGYKLGLKGVRDKTRCTRDEPGGSVPVLGLDSIGQLKCTYANARNMGNKREELEAVVQRDRYDLVAIAETWWWDGSRDWSAAMDG